MPTAPHAHSWQASTHLRAHGLALGRQPALLAALLRRQVQLGQRLVSGRQQRRRALGLGGLPVGEVGVRGRASSERQSAGGASSCALLAQRCSAGRAAPSWQHAPAPGAGPAPTAGG